MAKAYPPERDEGNIEYKLTLTKAGRERIERLASQMKYRLAEGGGEAFYVLGVSDEGEAVGLSDEEAEESLRVLEAAASLIGAKLQVVRVRRGRRGKVIELLARFSREESPPVYVGVAVLGNVDAGKSTLVSVLCTGSLDDGRGSAMALVARYLHEIETGRTSSVSTHLLGFSGDGQVVNYSLASPLDEAQIYLNSSKVVAFIDLGGHERYLRTTLRGVMARRPDYAMLVVGANAGLLRMGREHLGICVVLRIPVFAVVTKVDMVHREKVEETIDELVRVLKMPGVNRLPLLVRDRDDVVVAARHMPSGRVVPIFQVSSVTGKGLDMLRDFLNLLPPRMTWGERVGEPLLMYLDDLFNVRGVGPVVGGLILQGSVEVDSVVQLGPFPDGSWRSVRVKSIHVNRVPVQRAVAGQEATLAVANVKFEELEKGMAVLDRQTKPRSVWRLLTQLTILRHPTTIRPGYQAVLHIGAIRSTVTFREMEKVPMRTGDSGRVLLEFNNHPWYVREGDIFVLREARTRAIGRVLKVY